MERSDKVMVDEVVKTPWKKEDYDGYLVRCPWCGANGRVSNRKVIHKNGYTVTEIKVGCTNIYCAIKPFAEDAVVSSAQVYEACRDRAINSWNGLYASDSIEHIFRSV